MKETKIEPIVGRYIRTTPEDSCNIYSWSSRTYGVYIGSAFQAADYYNRRKRDKQGNKPDFQLVIKSVTASYSKNWITKEPKKDYRFKMIPKKD